MGNIESPNQPKKARTVFLNVRTEGQTNHDEENKMVNLYVRHCLEPKVNRQVRVAWWLLNTVLRKKRLEYVWSARCVQLHLIVELERNKREKEMEYKLIKPNVVFALSVL